MLVDSPQLPQANKIANSFAKAGGKLVEASGNEAQKHIQNLPNKSQPPAQICDSRVTREPDKQTRQQLYGPWLY